MAQGKGSVPGGPPTQVNKLDNMLGSLQSDLNKLGVQTVAKGVCGACCKPIVGQVRRFCSWRSGQSVVPFFHSPALQRQSCNQQNHIDTQCFPQTDKVGYFLFQC